MELAKSYIESGGVQLIPDEFQLIPDEFQLVLNRFQLLLFAGRQRHGSAR